MLASEYELVDETLQLVNNILEILEFPIEIQPENVNALFSYNLYIEISDVLFPFLQYNLLQISKKTAPPSYKIDMFIKILENDIVKRDLSHISGKAIAAGNMRHVFNLISVLYELTKRHAIKMDEGSEEDQHSVLDNYFTEYNAEEADSPLPKKKRYENLIEGQQYIDEQLNKIKRGENTVKKSEYDSENYGDVLERKNEYKAKNLKKQAKSPKNGKTTVKKYIEMRLFNQKTQKKLTSKPNIKAVSSQSKLSPTQKRLNQDLYKEIKKVRSQQKQRTEQTQSPGLRDVTETLYRKTRYAKYALKDLNYKYRLKEDYKSDTDKLMQYNFEKGIKYLKVKQKEQKMRLYEEERAMEMKIRDQKCRYLSRINHLVHRLYRDKNLDERKEFRDRLLKQNQTTALKLYALYNYYRNYMKLLREREQAEKKDRKVLEVAHRDIIKKLYRELKAEKYAKIKQLQDKFRYDYERLADFSAVEEDLVKLYKKF